MDFLTDLLRPALAFIRFPAEVISMAIVRPLTGSGFAAIVLDMIGQFSEDSILVEMAATMFGSTDVLFGITATGRNPNRQYRN